MIKIIITDLVFIQFRIGIMFYIALLLYYQNLNPKLHQACSARVLNRSMESNQKHLAKIIKISIILD